MSRNVPDGWDNYWNTCPRGHRYHASDGGCDACDMEDDLGIDFDDEEDYDRDYDTYQDNPEDDYYP